MEDEEEPEPVPLKRKSKKYLEESFSIRLFEKHPLGRNWLEFIREGNCKRWRSDEDFLRWVKIAMGYFSSLEPKQNCVSLNVNSAAHLLIGKLQLFPLEM